MTSKLHVTVPQLRFRWTEHARTHTHTHK